MEKSFKEAVDRFSLEFVQKTEYIYWIEQLQRFLKGKWCLADLEDGGNILKEFLYVRAVDKKRLCCGGISGLIGFVGEFIEFAENSYKVIFNIELDEIFSEFDRVGKINLVFDKFLNNPVLRKEPLLIDMERYKKRIIKNSLKNKTVNADKGYFMVMEVFSNNSIVFKKLYTGRFVRVVVDRELVALVKSEDIIYMSIRQNFFLGWDIEEVLRFYPKEASEYLIRTGV